MALRRKRVDRDNPERWLISYADFITLLFAFFVVMYAISSVNEGKYKTLGLSLGSAFGVKSGNPTEIGLIRLTEEEIYFKSIIDRRNAKLAEIQRRHAERRQQLVNKLNQTMSNFVKNGQMNVSETARGVMLEINANTLFAQGGADLAAAARNTLTDVAKVLTDNEQNIEVEGHTDDLPISTPQFPSNWELSSARASSVVRLFIDHGVQAKRLSAVGSADNHPVVNNDSVEGRTRNRRVTITVLNDDSSRDAQETIVSATEAASGIAQALGSKP
ncbi:MAG: flagellar motor protein MotD [Gallionellaceae bacterium]